MLAYLVAALLAPSPATAAPAPATPAPEAAKPAPAADSADILEAATPWWEKITVTVDDKGKQASCRYETSAAGSADCEPAMAASISPSKGTQGLFKKVTFERRFSPGGKPDAGKLAPGDTLLGRQVMYLTIDARGAIASCKVVATSGDSAPDYDCEAIKKEQFRAEASAAPASPPRQAFMTVLAYGHLEVVA